MLNWSALGAAPSGDRLRRMEGSPQWKGKFVNALKPRHEPWSAISKWVKGAPNREPSAPLPLLKRHASEFLVPPPSGLRVTWLGHSSMLVEMDGRRFLTDPVFSERISPAPRFGPRRFFPSPMEATELPPLDAVVISHDHFDHLDMATVSAIPDTTFVTPLGVGAHLEHWGISKERIVELDWWQSTAIGGVELACTPSRHFSGRSLTSRDGTLWAGWAILGKKHRVFFSGDTGMFPGFAEIGDKYGPFDLTMIESGAYDAAWADVHIGPEQAVRAHRILRGRVLMPIHWGTFNLALHAWTEPAERAIVEGRKQSSTLVLPSPGESFDPTDPPAIVRWWPDIPWQRAEEAPVVSSGMLIET
jgi:L-ascorbate metabolism protein UlaG (beta-lactamase superfamily)